MTTHIVAVAQNNSTFVWTMDVSQVADAYPALASSTIRMQIKTYPSDVAPLIEFGAGGNTAIYNPAGQTLQFLAPQSAVASISGLKYFDIRIETPAIGEFVVAYGTITFEVGPTVSAPAANAYAGVLPDTVTATQWEQIVGQGVLPVGINALTSILAQAAADEASAAASAASAAAAASTASGYILAAGGSVRVANAAALPAYSYANGTSGVGATITGSANGALAAIDGVTMAVSDRIWHWDYTGSSGGNLAFGIYQVTQLGDGTHRFILTRATDADTPGELGKVMAFVSSGAANIGKTLAIPIAAGSITVGVTALNPGVVSGPGGISAEAAARAAADAAEAAARAAADAAINASLSAAIATDSASVDNRGYGAEMLDSAGRIVLGFDGEGELRDSAALIGKVIASLSPTYGAAHEIPTLSGSMNSTDWHGLSGAGQSNMGASPVYAVPALTTTQPYNNKRAVPSGALISLVETSYESCMSAACNALKWRVLQELRPWSPPFIYEWIANNMGTGGAPYTSIEKGTSAYNGGINNVTNNKNQSVIAGKTYAERALLWIHGETDTANLVTRATYLADILQFYSDWTGDVLAITGQTDAIPMFITQLAYGDTYGNNTGPTLAMLDAAEANPNIFVNLSGYVMDFSYTDIHYPNYAQRLIGEYYAKAIHRYWIERRNPSTVRPLSWKIVSSTVIEVQFFVPVPPLVFDLDTVWPGDLGLGFAIYDSGGAEVPIADLRITASDKVRITATTSVAAGYHVTYAIKTYVRGTTGGVGPGNRRGARGNLRDNDSAIALYPDANGNAIRLPNWCVAFDKVL